MDGPTIFMGIVIVAVTAMVIYMFIDVNKYKETTDKELKDNDKDIATIKLDADNKIAKETQTREGNVNYIIDKTNEANQNLYTRFDKDVTAIQGNLNELNNASAAMSSVMRVTGTGSGTSTSGTSTVLGGTATNTNGRAITELPGSGTPNLELISSVMATNGMTVQNTLKTDKLQLGDKWQFSGVGDKDANDDWLRMFNKDGTGYSGGLAMGKLYTKDAAHLNGQTNVDGNLNVRGGTSEHNPNNAWTHLPWSGDNKNYIRGDTEIRGNTNNIGDLNVGRHASIGGRLHFSDPSMTKSSHTNNASDSYYLEKKVNSNNSSSLRLTLNDDNDESLQIWGGSCAAGDCSGDGTEKHKFDVQGNAMHAGNVSAKEGIILDVPAADKGIKAIHMTRTDEANRAHAWRFWHMNDAYGRNDMSLWEYAADSTGKACGGNYSDGARCEPALTVKSKGSIHTNRPVKLGHSHGSWTDNAVLSTQATGGRIGASFAGSGLWSHLPYSDGHSYIRPGQDDRSVIIGDVGQNVHLGRNDGGGITQVKSHWLRTRRHIDADIDWAGKGTTLFTGWVTDKTVVGNHKTGGHNFARDAPANTVVATNPVMVNGDVEAARICAGTICIRGQGNDLIMEDKAKTKSKVIGTL